MILAFIAPLRLSLSGAGLAGHAGAGTFPARECSVHLGRAVRPGCPGGVWGGD